MATLSLDLVAMNGSLDLVLKADWLAIGWLVLLACFSRQLVRHQFVWSVNSRYAPALPCAPILGV